MQERLDELETRIAFQDDTIQALNDVCTRQQEELSQLTRELEKLKAYVQTLTPPAVAHESEETPPPHY